ncbi:MAG TPA: hypothetical protein VN634_00905 [Candidatus Limnocylindrales bacterium]|nr:hypothetical protein [Candidatus Limnocylindrales bacterium]
MKNFIRFLGVAAFLSMAASPVSAAALTDHLQCFKISDALAKTSYTATLTPADITYQASIGCTVKVPAKLLCVDVAKSAVSPVPPGSAAGLQAQKYLCYKTKCTKSSPTDSLDDQFGTHAITVKSTGYLCAPVADAPTCSDLSQNGSETGVDCGGGSCPTCPDGEGCAGGSDCTSGTCSGGICVTLLSNGSPCSSGAQCSSSNCVDAFCCNSTCTGTCDACSAVKKGAGMNGACGPIQAGSDPDFECTMTSASTCGTDGFCDGSSACELYSNVTVCSAGSCSSFTQTAPSQCDGAGNCVPGGMSSCGLYACGPTACKTNCAAFSDCNPGTASACMAGACVP